MSRMRAAVEKREGHESDEKGDGGERGTNLAALSFPRQVKMSVTSARLLFVEG